MNYMTRRACLAAIAASPLRAATPSSLTLQLRGRAVTGEPSTSTLKIDPAKMAFIAVDVWTAHSCSGFNQYAEPLLGRLQETIDVCRALGMAIVFAPSGADLDTVSNLAARKNVLALPFADLPSSNGFLTGHGGNGPFAAPCMCPIHALKPDRSQPEFSCQRGKSNYNQHPALRIQDSDYFLSAGKYSPGTPSAIRSWSQAAQQELWNLVTAKHITHILYAGFAANMCIINREFAMIQARRMGLHPILIRDLTLAITYNGYNPMTRTLDPQFGPQQGTRYAIEYIEERIGPSVDSAQLLQARRSRP